MILIALALLFQSPLLAAQNRVAGTYQCAAFHAGKIFLPCKSMKLYLDKKGTYRLAGESGTYRVLGKSIVLSESRIRRPGRLLGRDEILFQYEYRGSRHTVLFRREELPKGWSRA